MTFAKPVLRDSNLLAGAGRARIPQHFCERLGGKELRAKSLAKVGPDLLELRECHIMLRASLHQCGFAERAVEETSDLAFKLAPTRPRNRLKWMLEMVFVESRD